jgi:N-methylhydantoinase A/oxoprolinase/acetone carboxylase beta subunit
MSACGAAQLAGVRRVLVPRLAAVFSAFGISFSDIGKSYEVGLVQTDIESAARAYDEILARAERDMFQEGYDLGECTTQSFLTVESSHGQVVHTRPYHRGDPVEVSEGHVSLHLDVAAALPQPTLTADDEVTSRPAVPHGMRGVRASALQVDVCPVYVLDEQEPGARSAGPAIVEGPFFTTRVPSGWTFQVTSNSDLILTDAS